MKWGNERKNTLGRVQQRRSRAEVEQLVDAFESSGLRRREFCQKHDVAVGRWFLAEEAEAETGEVKSHQLEARKVHAGAEGGEQRQACGVELADGDKRRVGSGPAAGAASGKSPRGLMPRRLERLLAVLEQA